ncbi:hypothetical protein EYF80_052916 [Liparis tanakae]|uniref:Uncharacterized protein n=1 Tax=Liparis tanakae TaxID=230148 RepID=A0A4Z2F711_9TELE|nr:hypothetical protein EYF80_052916 [Liparis tanakae]
MFQSDDTAPPPSSSSSSSSSSSPHGCKLAPAMPRRSHPSSSLISRGNRPQSCIKVRQLQYRELPWGVPAPPVTSTGCLRTLWMRFSPPCYQQSGTAAACHGDRQADPRRQTACEDRQADPRREEEQISQLLSELPFGSDRQSNSVIVVNTSNGVQQKKRSV